MVHHRLQDTGHIFVLKKNSIAFQLVDAGYVWLTNYRGGYCSHGHIEFDYNDLNGKFFDFTPDDIALIDLPSFIEYIKEKTGYQKINYIGHS